VAEAGKDGADVRGVAVEAEQHLREALLLLDRQRLEELLLAVEIDVEGTFRDAGRAGDLAHAGAVKSLGQKDPPGALEDLPPLAALAGLRIGRLGFALHPFQRVVHVRQSTFLPLTEPFSQIIYRPSPQSNRQFRPWRPEWLRRKD